MDSGQFTATQEAAAVALTSDLSFCRSISKLYQKRRDLVLSTLADLGISLTPSKASIYIWAPVPAGETSESFATKVLERAHVIITPGNGYGPDGEGFFRMSLTTPDDRLVEALDRMKSLL